MATFHQNITIIRISKISYSSKQAPMAGQTTIDNLRMAPTLTSMSINQGFLPNLKHIAEHQLKIVQPNKVYLETHPLVSIQTK